MCFVEGSTLEPAGKISTQTTISKRTEKPNKTRKEKISQLRIHIYFKVLISFPPSFPYFITFHYTDVNDKEDSKAVRKLLEKSLTHANKLL